MATNKIITPDMIALMMLAAIKNAWVLLGGVDRQLDRDFNTGRKKGESISVLKRFRYKAVDGPDITGKIQDSIGGSVNVTLDTFKTVAFEFSSTELTLEVEEFNERHVKPAAEELVQQVETAIAEKAAKGFYWFNGTPGTSPGYDEIAGAKAAMDNVAVPSNRNAYYGPLDQVALVKDLRGVFPTNIAKRAIEQAEVGVYAGFSVYQCQSIHRHTVGALGGVPVVAGADQNVTYDEDSDTWDQTLLTSGWSNDVTGVLKEGDVFTIADVYSVNPGTRKKTSELQTFVVRADANSSGTGTATLTIRPRIIIDGPYQTVDSAPADSAEITVLTGTAGQVSTQNLLFHKNAVTVAMAKIKEPQGNVKFAQQKMDGVSIRVVQAYDINTDQNICRCDILFGVEIQNPHFGMRQAGK